LPGYCRKRSSAEIGETGERRERQKVDDLTSVAGNALARSRLIARDYIGAPTSLSPARRTHLDEDDAIVARLRNYESKVAR